MRHLSHAVPKVAKQAFARKYIMLGRIVTQWADIVGPDLALKTAPAGLKRHKSDAGSIKVALDIAASPSVATMLAYRKDLILERINTLLGYGAISAIRFIPSDGSKRPAKPRKSTKSLTAEEKTYLSHVVEAVEDPDIRMSLQALGTAMLQDGNRKS